MDAEYTTHDSLTVPGEPKNLSRIRSFVRNTCREMKFTPQKTDEILVAVGEACNNAILHGSSNSREETITIAYQEHTDRVEFIITDSGSGFDPTNVRYGSPEKMEEGKLGIKLMRMLADEVHFHTSPDGTTVRLIFIR